MAQKVINEKTWSELKIKNPSEEVCQAMREILALFDEKVATKALERIILNCIPNHERQKQSDRNIAELNREIAALKSELKKKEESIAHIKQVYSQFHNLLIQ